MKVRARSDATLGNYIVRGVGDKPATQLSPSLLVSMQVRARATKKSPTGQLPLDHRGVSLSVLAVYGRIRARILCSEMPSKMPVEEDIDNSRLIEEVESRPLLYDKKLKEYSDVNAKSKGWEEVCQQLFQVWGQLSAKEKTEAVPKCFRMKRLGLGGHFS